MNVTRRYAIMGGVGAALSTINPSILRAEFDGRKQLTNLKDRALLSRVWA